MKARGIWGREVFQDRLFIDPRELPCEGDGGGSPSARDGGGHGEGIPS